MLARRAPERTAKAIPLLSLRSDTPAYIDTRLRLAARYSVGRRQGATWNAPFAPWGMMD